MCCVRGESFGAKHFLGIIFVVDTFFHYFSLYLIRKWWLALAQINAEIKEVEEEEDEVVVVVEEEAVVVVVEEEELELKKSKIC
jgi:hypothetical protein